MPTDPTIFQKSDQQGECSTSPIYVVQVRLTKKTWAHVAIFFVNILVKKNRQVSSDDLLESSDLDFSYNQKYRISGFSKLLNIFKLLIF